MRIFKALAVFLCLNLLISLAMQFVLTSPSQQPIRYQAFQEGEYNSVIIGHSLAERGLDPRELEVEEGDSAFNLCIGGAPFHNLYYLLRDLNRDSGLDKVYLDIYWPYWTESFYRVNYVDYDQQLLHMMSPGSRWEFWKEERAFENYNKTLFPYKLDSLSLQNLKKIRENLAIKLDPRYRDRSTEMLSVMYDPEQYTYAGRGYVYGNAHIPEIDPDYDFWAFDEREISPEAVADFDRIVDYCKENEITLYCVESALLPIRLQNENHDVSHDYFAELCGSRGVAYLDMNYVRYELLPRGAEDYEDTDGHMTGAMAARQTALLRQILQSEEPESFFEKDYASLLQGIEDYSQTP